MFTWANDFEELNPDYGIYFWVPDYWIPTPILQNSFQKNYVGEEECYGFGFVNGTGYGIELSRERWR